jgi:hypothetical protein
MQDLFDQYLQYGYWKVRVIQKHRIPASWRHLIPGVFLLILFVLLAASALSALAAVFWPSSSVASQWPIWLLGGAIGLYGMCGLAASICTAVRTELKLFPVLPLVFACYHFGYGLGFLTGILDFCILRKHARDSFTRLTRKNPKNKLSSDEVLSRPTQSALRPDR